MEVVGDQEAAKPIEEQPETAGGSAWKEQVGTEEMVEAEVPLSRKRRRLVKAGHLEPVQERVTAQSTGPGRDGVDHTVI